MHLISDVKRNRMHMPSPNSFSAETPLYPSYSTYLVPSDRHILTSIPRLQTTMCWQYASLDQATGVCPMCKVFKPIGAARYPCLPRPHTSSARLLYPGALILRKYVTIEQHTQGMMLFI